MLPDAPLDVNARPRYRAAMRLAVTESGAGAPVVLVPGVGQEAWHWHRVTAHLSSSRRCLAVSLRGFGGSPSAPPPWSTRDLAEDVAETLRDLGVEAFTLVGHSLGGLVAQELALAHPSRVARLVLVSTTPGGPRAVPVEPEALAVMMRRDGDARTLFQRGLDVSTAPGWSTRDPDGARALWDFRARFPADGAAYAAQVMAGAGHDAGARLPGLRMPCTAVTGALDRVVPPANAPLLASLVPGAGVHVIPGAGHQVHWEAPAQLAEVILSA